MIVAALLIALHRTPDCRPLNHPTRREARRWAIRCHAPWPPEVVVDAAWRASGPAVKL